VANRSIASENSKKEAIANERGNKNKRISRKMELSFLQAVNLCELADVKDYLSKGVDAHAISNDGSKKTALHLACEHMSQKYFPIVVALLRSGASVLTKDNNGRLPIDLTINPHVAGLLHLHTKRIKNRDFTKDERRKLMQIMTGEYVGERAKQASRSNTRRSNHSAYLNRTLCDKESSPQRSVLLSL